MQDQIGEGVSAPIVLKWPNQPWFQELMELLSASPWTNLLRLAVLCKSTIWHPNPELQDLHVCQFSRAGWC